MGGPALAVRALCDTMTSADVNPSARGKAAGYLADIAYRSTVGYSLTPSLLDGKPTTGDLQPMVEPLRAALRDEFAGVRERAVMALGHLGDKGALEEVLNLLGDENDRVRYFTAKVLGDLSDERAVPALRQAVKDYPDMAGAVRAVLASLK
jgi:hypothetical protein